MEKPKVVDPVTEQERPIVVGTKTIDPDEIVVCMGGKEDSYFPDDDSY